MTTQNPAAELIGTLHALIRVMEEESEALASHLALANYPALAHEKARHMRALGRLCVHLRQQNPYWVDDLVGDDRRHFLAARDDLRKAALINATVARESAGPKIIL